ncbi:MAG: co-chaperone YbbN [Gammaproteobacteria bacterium]|nr:co-chaperone YbbN [Gammaproteobacteria bacterium]
MSDSPFVHNVTAEDFQSLVIENSFKQPVLVDFWAEWCNPCQVLIPILTKLADEYNGAFILAKVNSDEQGELAAQAGVRSLPTVKLFVDGQIVDEFMGALPEPEVKKFLDQHIQSESDVVLNDAMLAYQEGREQDALDMLNAALAHDPQNAKLKINIAKLVANQGDLQSARALAETLNDEEKQQPEAKELITQLKLAQQLQEAGDPNEIEQKLKDNPDDLDALYQMSNIQTASGNYEAAIQMLMKIMQKDRSFKDDAGRKGLIDIFDMLGSDNPLVQTYRRKMFTLLH